MGRRTYKIGKDEYTFNTEVFKRAVNTYTTKHKKTKKAFADAIDTPNETVNTWHYKGGSPNDLDMVKRIAEVLDMDYSELLTPCKTADNSTNIKSDIMQEVVKMLENITNKQENIAMESNMRLIDEVYNMCFKALFNLRRNNPSKEEYLKSLEEISIYIYAHSMFADKTVKCRLAGIVHGLQFLYDGVSDEFEEFHASIREFLSDSNKVGENLAETICVFSDYAQYDSIDDCKNSDDCASYLFAEQDYVHDHLIFDINDEVDAFDELCEPYELEISEYKKYGYKGNVNITHSMVFAYRLSQELKFLFHCMFSYVDGLPCDYPVLSI